MNSTPAAALSRQPWLVAGRTSASSCPTYDTNGERPRTALDCSGVMAQHENAGTDEFNQFDRKEIEFPRPLASFSQIKACSVSRCFPSLEGCCARLVLNPLCSLCLPLEKPHARTAFLVDELNASALKSALNDIKRRATRLTYPGFKTSAR